GKTTLLKVLSGLIKPETGKIIFDGEDVTNLPPHKRVEKGISLIPEGRLLFTRLTVEENLLLGATTEKARIEREKTLKWVCQLFPILEERKKQIAGTLSGGEQQMLAIARGLMSKPKLLILDEPSWGLAPKIVVQLFDLIKEINNKGITILLVEQNVWRTLEISDKAYVIETGRIVLSGSGKELLENEYVRKTYLGL
ncbi:MAG: ABC transporter ATP-binding protein, partial [Dictyoglomus sp.]|nr:ABC transporter ATP-binding protein [Dictyoglomus sp.]MDW8189327.1 ABC transporter ATP-binding protein [Dictyoglomus sp.]